MPLPRVAVRVLAFTIAMAFGASVWAACAEAAISSSAAMACCKDGEMTCAPHGSAKDCCTTDAARPREAIGVARITPSHSLIAVVAWAVTPSLAMLGETRQRAETPASRPHLEFGPPPYIAFSSLLI